MVLMRALPWAPNNIILKYNFNGGEWSFMVDMGGRPRCHFEHLFSMSLRRQKISHYDSLLVLEPSKWCLLYPIMAKTTL